MSNAHAPIFLLTDFGTADPFVGVMKAVALSMGYGGKFVDLSHEVPPQDLRRAVVVLEDALPWLPDGAVACIVVDPGVGTNRDGVIALDSRGRQFIAPDNGVLAPVIAGGAPVRRIAPGGPITPDQSATFHGRDVFMPAAVLAAMDTRPFAEFGEIVSSPAVVEFAPPRIIAGGRLELEVISFDRFGNGATNLRRETVPEGIDLEKGEFLLAGHRLGPLRRTYGDVEPGQPVAYYNSFGRLEVAISNGSARDYFLERIGVKVIFVPVLP